MGYKSRGNFRGVCVRTCMNRDKKCKDCIKYSEYIPKKENND